MAHIYTTPKGVVRAQVYRHGTRKSRTFKTTEAAQAWAAEMEERIEAVYEPRRLAEDPLLLSFFPRRVLEAIQAAPFTSKEILAGAIDSPALCGVYFLIADGEVKYVGKSSNVLQRIAKHMANGYRFDSYNAVRCQPEKLSELECLYITALMPPWNQGLGGPGQGVSIKPRRASTRPAAGLL